MPWRRVAPALVVPALLLGLNLVVVLSDVLSGEPLEWGLFVAGPVAGLLAFANGAAIVVFLRALSAIARAAELTASGRHNPFTACVRTYRVAAGSTIFGGATLSGSVLTMIELQMGPTATWVAVHGLMWALIWVLAASFLLVRVPSAGGPATLRLRGRAAPLDPASPLGSVVESAARSAGAARPAHVVFGFDPGIASLHGEVEVGDQRLGGGALYVSLPMLRVLDRGELAGLIAFGLADQPLLRAGWRPFLAWAREQSGRILDWRPSNRVMRATLGVVFLPVEVWKETWQGIELHVLRYAAQRGAVVAGREMMASALARQFLYPETVGRILSGLRRELKEAEPSSPRLNVSDHLSKRWSTLPAEPGFANLFGSLDALRAEQPLLATLIAGLGVEPSAVIESLSRAPSDPAIDLVEDSASIELDLSRELVKAFMPAWPATREPGREKLYSTTSTEAEDDAPLWQQATAVPAGIQRPVFASMPESHWSVEGVVIGVVTALFLTWMVAWAAVEPAVYRIFPEVGATKVGPKVFPFTVRLGRETIGFTNGSGAAWSCTAEVGHMNGSFVATFWLAPHQTQELSYVDFRSPTPEVSGSAPEVRRAAREKGRLECTEPSGISHLGGW